MAGPDGRGAELDVSRAAKLTRARAALSQDHQASHQAPLRLHEGAPAVRLRHLLPGPLCRRSRLATSCSELTLKQTRRLLEDDLQLPEKTLDEEPHKSLIKHQVDEACRACALVHSTRF